MSNASTKLTFAHPKWHHGTDELLFSAHDLQTGRMSNKGHAQYQTNLFAVL